jgi:hypothetical protein
MYPHDETYRKSPEAMPSHMLDTVVALGPYAASALAAWERHQEAQQYASQSIATHQAREHTPCAFRRWSGEFLVRTGRRLQGAAVSTGGEMLNPAAHPQS